MTFDLPFQASECHFFIRDMITSTVSTLATVQPYEEPARYTLTNIGGTSNYVHLISVFLLRESTFIIEKCDVHFNTILRLIHIMKRYLLFSDMIVIRFDPLNLPGSVVQLSEGSSFTIPQSTVDDLKQKNIKGTRPSEKRGL